jgi:hypothetical protein
MMQSVLKPTASFLDAIPSANVRDRVMNGTMMKESSFLNNRSGRDAKWASGSQLPDTADHFPATTVKARPTFLASPPGRSLRTLPSPPAPLKHSYGAFDDIVDRHGVFKVGTVGTFM